MKKITIVAMSIFLLAACTKENKQITLSIRNSLQSDPDPKPTTACGGYLFYGTFTHLGQVHGKGVSQTCPFNADNTQLAITADDITYAGNGEELWTKTSIVITFPTDGSTTATVTGGAKITGGTGRFEGATGYLIYENMVYDLVTGHESHTSHGKITLVRD
jgi:hypothetical protein